MGRALQTIQTILLAFTSGSKPYEAGRERNPLTFDENKTYHVWDDLPDGSVVGPVSPTTGKNMGIEPADTALKGMQKWKRGQEHARALRESGYTNARQPDPAETNALKRSFQESAGAAEPLVDPSLNSASMWTSETNEARPSEAFTSFMGQPQEILFPSHKKDEVAQTRCVFDLPPGIKVTTGPA